MSKVNFDDHAENYNQILGEQLHFFDGDNAYFSQYKILKAREFFKDEPANILDFGCGIGRCTDFMKQYFPNSNVYGCDVSEESLNLARKKFPDLQFEHIEKIAQLNLKFDFIFLSCVLHHVEPRNRNELMQFIKKLLSPTGVVMIFEHNPLNPVTRHMVNTCVFDKDAVLLKPREIKKLFKNAGIQQLDCQYTLFFPAFLKFLRPLEKFLKFVPMGGQYFICGQV